MKREIEAEAEMVRRQFQQYGDELYSQPHDVVPSRDEVSKHMLGMRPQEVLGDVRNP